MRLRARPHGHQLQPSKVPWSPSCIGAYHYMLKALFFAHRSFFFDFRGQMSLMGEKCSLKPKKKL
jgi:hypothetical protein